VTIIERFARWLLGIACPPTVTSPSLWVVVVSGQRVGEATTNHFRARAAYQALRLNGEHARLLRYEAAKEETS
jgi:hypothetical protein